MGNKQAVGTCGSDRVKWAIGNGQWAKEQSAMGYEQSVGGWLEKKCSIFSYQLSTIKMAVHLEFYKQIIAEFKQKNVTLVAVSKTKSFNAILELYELGQRDFGESYVQELVEKHAQLPGDIRWHFIGHLQSNKVKLIAPFISLIHSVDSLKLLKEINKQALKNDRVIDCLLQVYIAKEATKFGLDDEELNSIIGTINPTDPKGKMPFKNICIKGFMGMASFTDDKEMIREEFRILKTLFDKYASLSSPAFQLSYVSMGMSADYKMAIEEGSNMVRIGSLLFGERHYHQ